MTRARRRNTKLERIYDIYHKILARLPKTFPQTSLVIHANMDELQAYYLDSEGLTKEEEEGYLPAAFCDGNTYTVHVPLTLYKENVRNIAWYYLHELGHLYALHRYGFDDDRWANHEDAERYANRFATRWLNKLKKEGLVKN